MINNGHRYIKTIIEIDKFLRDTANRYMLISQRPFRGKYDADGNCEIPEGVTVGLQILEDHSDPVIDKNTGEVKQDNTYETFDATIVGVQYPLSINKGSTVRLYDFLDEYSYYINYTFILRFSGIEELESVEENEDITD